MPQFRLQRTELDQFAEGTLQADISLHRAIELVNNSPCKNYVDERISTAQSTTATMMQELLDHAQDCSDALFHNKWQSSSHQSEKLDAAEGVHLLHTDGRPLSYRELYEMIDSRGMTLKSTLPIELWSSIVLQTWSNQRLQETQNNGRLDPTSARVVHFLDSRIHEDANSLYSTELLRGWIEMNRAKTATLLSETHTNLHTHFEADELLLFLAYWRFTKERFLSETGAIELID
jgi:hypothetical protein